METIGARALSSFTPRAVVCGASLCARNCWTVGSSVTLIEASRVYRRSFGVACHVVLARMRSRCERPYSWGCHPAGTPKTKALTLRYREVVEPKPLAFTFQWDRER